MRSASACLRTSGPCVSNQYFWNSSRDSRGSRRRQKLSLIMAASVSRAVRELPSDHDLGPERLAQHARGTVPRELGAELALELRGALAEQPPGRARMGIDAAEHRVEVALQSRSEGALERRRERARAAQRRLVLELGVRGRVPPARTEVAFRDLARPGHPALLPR